VADNASFQNLIRRIRAGDQEAATELTSQVEPALRKAIRLRLAGQHLERFLDPNDVCQSVLMNFFSGVAAGRFILEEPRQLLKLLVTIARNQVRDESRRHRARRRDRRRTEDGSAEHCLAGIRDAGPTPSKIVGGRELVREIYRRLSPEERYLAEQRVLGRSWAVLGAELNQSPEALRKRLDRAVREVSRQLGLGRQSARSDSPTPLRSGSRPGHRPRSAGAPDLM
jgi:DNA-directed RNA polymerase specialized sigma24 family protein